MKDNAFIGKDGLNATCEIIAGKLTYDRVVEFMINLLKSYEATGMETRMLDQLLWITRWAYLNGIQNALAIYDRTVSTGPITAERLAETATTMIDSRLSAEKLEISWLSTDFVIYKSPGEDA